MGDLNDLGDVSEEIHSLVEAFRLPNVVLKLKTEEFKPSIYSDCLLTLPELSGSRLCGQPRLQETGGSFIVC